MGFGVRLLDRVEVRVEVRVGVGVEVMDKARVRVSKGLVIWFKLGIG